jgi:histone H2A
MATPKASTGRKPKSAGAGAKKGGKSVSARLGLIFPVGRTGSRLRQGRYARRVGAAAPVYLAAVMEYLTC